MRVNMGTKAAEGLIHDMNYHHYKGKTIYEVYSSMSSKKAKSWEDISRECASLHGEHLHIVGASCHMYSCIYAYPICSEETGEIVNYVIRKHTKGGISELVLPVDEYLKRIHY